MKQYWANRPFAFAALLFSIAAELIAASTGAHAAGAGAAITVRDKMALVLQGLKSADFTSTIDVTDAKTKETSRLYVHTQYQKPNKLKITLSDTAFDAPDSNFLLADGSVLYEYDHKGNSFARTSIQGSHIALPNGLSGAQATLMTVNELLGAKPFADMLQDEEGGAPLTIKRHGLDVAHSSLLASQYQDRLGLERGNKIWVDTEDSTPHRITQSILSGDTETEFYHEEFKTFKEDPVLPESTFKWVAPENVEEITPPPTGDPIKPGQLDVVAPEFTMKDRTDESVSLSEFKGRVVILCFWSSASPESVTELPHLEKMYQDLGTKGLAVLAVNTMEDSSFREAYLKKNKFTIEILADPDLLSKSLYGVTTLPTTFIIGRDGNVVASHVGFDAANGEADLRNQLSGLKIR